jgi:coniferyl-aldehyde dehydrogenase
MPQLTDVPRVEFDDAAEVGRMRQVLLRQRAACALMPFPDAAHRRENLRKLVRALKRNHAALIEAVSADFGVRAAPETSLIEVLGPVLEARHALSHLKKWMKPRRRRTELLFAGNSAWVEYQPKGVVGILGTWNFPVYLTLGPLVAALAAGNRAMVKVSETTPRTFRVVQRFLGECFDESEVAVFCGGPQAAEAFTELPFDHIVFTGSPQVGRAVMRAAAANLTPVTLELGGKSPAIVGTAADLEDAALRIAHGKVFNAGQICVAPDYAMVPRGEGRRFAEAVSRAFQRLVPTVTGNPEYTSIVSDRHAARMRQLLADARAKAAEVVPCSPEAGTERQIPLHVLLRVTPDMQVMREEIFGPLLPVVEYDDLDSALATVRSGERPLAMYGFGLDAAERRHLLQQSHAGGVTFDDWGWHVFQHDLPFGGVGNSGIGGYHGEEGFRELSHGKSVFRKRRWFPIGLFYPPYGNVVQRLALRFYLGRTPGRHHT